MYSLRSPATMPPLSAFEISPPFSSPPSPLHAESPTLPSSPLVTSPPPAVSFHLVLPPPSEIVPASSPLFMPQPTPDPPVSPPPSTITLLPPPAPLPSPAAPVSQPLPFPFPSAPVNFPPLAPVPPAITFPPTSPAHLPSPAAPVSQPPPFPFPSAPVNFPPFAPVPQAITFPPTSPQVTSSPPANSPAPPLRMPFPEPQPWSSAAPPTSPLEPPSSSSLPVAVEVNMPSGFNMSSAAIVGLVIGGAILIAFILGLLTLLCLCRSRNRREKKHDRTKEPPNVGSKGSHIIQVESHPIRRPTISHGRSKGSGSANSGSENAIPNHAPIITFGSGNHIFTYDELVVATNGFSEVNLLGQGGFGNVYKGVLPNGKEIAVKQLKTGSQQGEREFQAEVETISRVHHKHLVELVGYCINRAERLLVYECVPNNTLEFHLHGEGKSVMEWTTRMKIAVGSAKGLAYLHEDCNPAVIHRDIKASNILLDFGFEAKVSDFGMAKIFPNTDSCITHITTRVVGTFGYLAPEYASSGKLTDKSDVYSYGVMLLELITGRLPIRATESSMHENLVDWARPLLTQALEDGDFNNLVDPRLQKNYRDEEMARMIACAAACVRHSARLRPRMSQVVGALEGLVSLSNLAGDIKPGHTALYSWSGSSNYDAKRYQEDIRNFNLALSSQKYSCGGNSESTSAYGLSPSDSSREFLDTK